MPSSVCGARSLIRMSHLAFVASGTYRAAAATKATKMVIQTRLRRFRETTVGRVKVIARGVPSTTAGRPLRMISVPPSRTMISTNNVRAKAAEINNKDIRLATGIRGRMLNMPANADIVKLNGPIQ